jgi:hypothetical protein
MGLIVGDRHGRGVSLHDPEQRTCGFSAAIELMPLIDPRRLG